MDDKTPEQIYLETPDVVKKIAQKVLKIERDSITQAYHQEVVDNLIALFREDLTQ